MISERQWRNLNKKLNNITCKLEIVEQKLRQKPKKWLKFEESVPPASVCEDVASMMDGIDSYTGFLGRLSEYYGCESMGFFVDKTINAKYLAVYYPTLKEAHSRTNTLERRDVLHEFFHHLVNLNVVVINKKDEEKLADKYADAFLRRCQSNG